MLKVECARGCTKSIIGPTRQGDNEFPKDVLEGFLFVVEHNAGWKKQGENWVCEDPDCKPPWDLKTLQTEFDIDPERLKKIKPFRADYFSTVTISNLDP